jgi:hypothetical protein
MSEFNPTRPSLVNDQLNGPFEWEPERWAKDYRQPAQEFRPGAMIWDCLLLDGWKPLRRLQVVKLLSSRIDLALRLFAATAEVDVPPLLLAGYPTIQPATLLSTEQDAGLADIYCDNCVPPWRALQVDPKREPWRVTPGYVLACPGCRQRLQVRVRQPAWQPAYVPRPEF